MSWYYLNERATGAQPVGPFSDEQMEKLVLQGTVKKSTGVLHQIKTGGHWINAKDSPEVFSWIDAPRRLREEAEALAIKRKAEKLAADRLEKERQRTEREASARKPELPAEPSRAITNPGRRAALDWKTWAIRLAITLAAFIAIDIAVYLTLFRGQPAISPQPSIAPAAAAANESQSTEPEKNGFNEAPLDMRFSAAIAVWSLNAQRDWPPKFDPLMLELPRAWPIEVMKSMPKLIEEMPYDKRQDGVMNLARNIHYISARMASDLSDQGVGSDVEDRLSRFVQRAEKNDWFVTTSKHFLNMNDGRPAFLAPFRGEAVNQSYICQLTSSLKIVEALPTGPVILEPINGNLPTCLHWYSGRKDDIEIQCSATKEPVVLLVCGTENVYRRSGKVEACNSAYELDWTLLQGFAKLQGRTLIDDFGYAAGESASVLDLVHKLDGLNLGVGPGQHQLP